MEPQLISKTILRKYIDSVINLIIIDFDVPSDDPSLYDQTIFDDLKTWVKDDHNPWTEDELRIVLKEIRKRLWRNEPLPSSDQIKQTLLVE